MSNLYLYIVVEGKGEQTFVGQTLAVHLAKRSVWATAFLVGKPSHQGGVRSWVSVRRELCGYLRMQRPRRPMYVSLMFDYFRMPTDWPGRAAAPSLALANRAGAVETALAGDICSVMGDQFDPSRFVPYVQMHELEALILAQPEALVTEFPDRAKAVAELAKEVGNLEPEEVNDGPDTAPSKRITKRIPEYAGRKATAAPNVLSVIGVPTLRQRCPHFDQWIGKLEALTTR
jgi:hypothetical protein